MTNSRSVFLSCALALATAGFLPAASISLDTTGADPDITSPFFTFTTDTTGSFNAMFHNVSSPAMDFITLTLVAPFSSTFYTGPTGPRAVGVTCNGGNAFNTCGITLNDATFTLTLTFSGLDATHIGLPYLDFLGVTATQFEPNQTIQAAAGTATPEPGSVVMAGTGVLLAGLFISRKKLLKLGVRA